MTENSHKGKCFCGNVEFEVSGSPAASVYCHCTDCRGWLGAPVHAATLWPKDKFKYTKGQDNLTTFKKTEASHRQSCKTCGGHVAVQHPGMGMVDVMASGIPTHSFKPTLHLFYSEKMISMKDGLPKFAKMPKEFGGSGETLPE